MKKSQTKYKIIFFVILSLISIQVAHAHSNDQQLAGTWSSKCAADGSGNFNIETFVFSGQSAKYSVKTYSDSSCKDPISTLTTYRTFKLGQPAPRLANTKKLDYVFKSVTMTFKNAAAVAAANKQSYYGLTHWKLNQPKTVTGLKYTPNSHPEHKKGEKFYTIVKFDKNKIYMGDYGSGAGTSNKTRLSTIYNVPFIHQPPKLKK